MLRLVWRAEGDVMHAPDADLPVWPQVRPLLQMHLGPRPARSDLEDDHPHTVPFVLTRGPETERLFQYPRSRPDVPHRERRGVQA